MERNNSSTFAWASPSRTVHFELMVFCVTCFTRDLKDPAFLDLGPVSVSEIMK